MTHERLGHRPGKVGAVSAGWVLVPIGDYSWRPGLSFSASDEAVVLDVDWEHLEAWLTGTPEGARHLTAALCEALDAQHWTLRLAAQAEPLARLASLLLRIAESRGVEQTEGLLLDGVPDARELAALAGISRENALIGLEWLIHAGTLRRANGRIWVVDLEALKAVDT
ncbi:MAG: helix-turn-helix domain-containing protein, partial [Chloroflexota bacterium]|nr:helix-turn-helix domain-containing protein [Chloroflexota bacterium]